MPDKFWRTVFHRVGAGVLTASIAAIFGCAAASEPDCAGKIAEVRSGALREARAEWWGFNGKDDSAALQDALNSGAAKVVVGKKAGPWMLSRPLMVPRRVEVVFEDGAELMAREGCFTGPTDMLVRIREADGVTLRGKGILTMRRKDYQDTSRYKAAEWRHALEIFNSNNVLIEGLTLRESGGDGIYLNGGKNITISGVDCAGNHRQGISVISGENITIKDSVFRDTSGTNPQAGLDFEPNHWKEKIVNCVVENCRFVGNAGSGVEFMLQAMSHNSPPLSITLRDCVIENNKRGVMFVNYKAPSIRGGIKFENCRVSGSEASSFRSSGQTADGYSVTLKNCVIDNSASKDPGAVRLEGGYVSGAVGNLRCDGVEVVDPRADAEPFAFNDWDLYPLRNLTGKIRMAGRPDFELSKALDRSKEAKPFAMASMDESRCAPVGESAAFPAASASPWRARFSGTFLQYAKAGANVRVDVEIEAIGRNNAGVEVSVQSPSGKSVGSWKIPLAEKKGAVCFSAQETGVYRLYYLSNFQGMFLRSALPGGGYLANSSVHCNHKTGRMYFLVPAGVADVAVKVGGDSENEHVSAVLRDPSGAPVVKRAGMTKPTLLHHRRANTAADEAWSLEVTDAVDDFNVTIMGGSIPVFSDSPDKLLKTDVSR